MTDATEPRDPRVDPPVAPTPTAPGETSSTPCVMLDIYQHPVRCDTPDPCTVAATTLYRVRDCGPENPPLAVWCVDYPQHPACVSVAVGDPPVPGLPATGGAVGLSLAVALVVAGCVMRLTSRRAA